MPPFESTLAAAMHTLGNEPETIQQAKPCPDWPKWEEALGHESAQHKSLGTWKLVELPPHLNTIGSCWVLCYKVDSTGKFVKYKGQLVAQGFSQAEGIDYNETFSPTAKLSVICTITFSQSTYINRILHHFSLHDANLLLTPMDPHHWLTKAQCPSTPCKYELM